jgi:hypothetical protein
VVAKKKKKQLLPGIDPGISACTPSYHGSDDDGGGGSGCGDDDNNNKMCAYFLVILGKGTADACLLVTTS